LARSYDVAAAALTLDVPIKWVDNLLSRHRIPGVEQTRQGVTRRLSQHAITTIALVWILCEELGITASKAVDLAARMTTAGDATLTFGEGSLVLGFDRATVARRLAERVADAVESAPRRPRGRPRTTSRRDPAE
jgi:hypothetical protein